MVTIIVDRETGKVYKGISGKKESATGNKRTDLTAKLKHRLGGENSKEKWSKDNCYEIDTLNKAYKDGAKDKNMVMHSREIKQDITRKKCQNCQHSNSDIQTTSECGI